VTSTKSEIDSEKLQIKYLTFTGAHIGVAVKWRKEKRGNVVLIALYFVRIISDEEAVELKARIVTSMNREKKDD
jgi:hypothetical protein